MVRIDLPFPTCPAARWGFTPGKTSILTSRPYGTIELSQTDGPNFKVNGHRLKHYFGGDIPYMVVPDLQTFPKDQCIRGRVKLRDLKQALRLSRIFEASHARGFFLCSQELQILNFIWEIQYRNLID
ncbi:hypothetical protein Tco_0363534 [Tanacetum coccineum]